VGVENSLNRSRIGPSTEIQERDRFVTVHSDRVAGNCKSDPGLAQYPADHFNLLNRREKIWTGSSFRTDDQRTL
jgi:hypothetical protein